MADALVLWGKSGADGKPHPLLLHMLDSGMVARALIQAPQWRRIRESLIRLADLDASQLHRSMPFLVALHDLGKAAPGFQRLVPSLWSVVEGEGLVDAHPMWRGVRFRHDIESYAILEESFLPQWVEPVLTDATPLRRRRVFLGLAQALGGHHGAFISAGEVRPSGAYPQVAHDSAAAGDRGWIDVRLSLARALSEAFEVDSPIRVAPGHLSAFCSTLNGFAILCDWIASNEEYFPCAGMAPRGTYPDVSWERAQAAVERAGLLRYPESSVAPTFTSLFPKYAERGARPLQAALDVDGLREVAGPMVAVIEAPTGEGKTEAALLLAQRLTSTSGGGGMYFALPTTATSEQLFRRIAEFFSESHRSRGTAGLALIHGQADLSPEVQRLTQRDEHAAGDAAATEPVVIDSWLLPRKRALLAPFAVGTVDQAMLAALRVRHGSLRLLGLAGKVVIIDEVHAYDAYMNVIIVRLLEWLAELGVSVILLSATLPAAARARLLSAYGVADTTERVTVAYPLITLGRAGAAPVCIEPAASDPGRSVGIELLESSEVPGTVARAVAAAAAGASVGVGLRHCRVCANRLQAVESGGGRACAGGATTARPVSRAHAGRATPTGRGARGVVGRQAERTIVWMHHRRHAGRRTKP